MAPKHTTCFFTCSRESRAGQPIHFHGVPYAQKNRANLDTDTIFKITLAQKYAKRFYYQFPRIAGRAAYSFSMGVPYAETKKVPLCRTQLNITVLVWRTQKRMRLQMCALSWCMGVAIKKKKNNGAATHIIHAPSLFSKKCAAPCGLACANEWHRLTVSLCVSGKNAIFFACVLNTHRYEPSRTRNARKKRSMRARTRLLTQCTRNCGTFGC